MFLGVTELIQGPEGIIASFVWAEIAKERRDFRGEVFADLSFSVDVVVKAGQIIAERKVGPFGVLSPACDGAGVSRLIKDGSQIVDSIEKDAGKVSWQTTRKDDLMKIVDSITVSLDSVGPRLIGYKLGDLGVEIVDVMLCSIDSELRASERVCHDENLKRDRRYEASYGRAHADEAKAA